MIADRFTDLAFERDAEGIYDLVIDDDGDLKVTAGVESAIFISLFSDRRAYPDEVADPWKRRGTILDITAEIIGDRHGSGLWLYEQSRLTREIALEVELEAEQALSWMVRRRLAQFVIARAEMKPADRALWLNVDVTIAGGGVVSVAYQLWDATRTGELARNT